MHVVVVVERVEEVGDFLARGVARVLGEVLGEVADFGGDDVPAGGLQGFGNGVEVLDLGEEARAFLAGGNFLGFERLDFLRAGFDGIAFGVAVGVGVGGFDDAEVVEEEGDAAGLAEGAGLEDIADLRRGAVAVVGQALDDHRHFVRREALVGDQFEVDLLVGLPGALLDGALDGVAIARRPSCAFSTAAARRGFRSGSAPPSLAATMISRTSLATIWPFFCALASRPACFHCAPMRTTTVKNPRDAFNSNHTRRRLKTGARRFPSGPREPFDARHIKTAFLTSRPPVCDPAMALPEKLLRELIALPSVNPAFLPPGDSRAGEQRVADFLAATAARAGLEVEYQEVFHGRANLLAWLKPSSKPRQCVAFVPHMDTVGVSTEAQFKPIVRNDCLYGRGACDTKGSIAVMLAALTELARSGHRPAQTELVFAALVDEESGQGGSRFLARSGFKADLAIVGEPTRLRVVTAHKGDLWLKLETRGRAAHGSRPELGRNAVHSMAKIVDLLETDYAARLRKRRHSLLRHATINVGAIAGGRQPNIVPDSCAIQIDRRTIPGETDAAVKREILRFIRGRGLSVTMSDTKDEQPAPALEADTRLPLVREFLRCAGQSKPAGVDFFTDAGVLASAGIPSVVFGPGDIAQAHTADEWIALNQLERGVRILGRFLASLS